MPKFVVRLSSALVLSVALFAAAASAQSIEFRQTNLSSDITTPGFSGRVNPLLRNPSSLVSVPGLGFLMPVDTGRAFFADSQGRPVGPTIGISNPSSNAAAVRPVAVADPKSLFATLDPLNPLATDVLFASSDGGIYIWGINPDGSFLTQATLAVDHSGAGAVYTSLAILTPSCCAPFLAVANFHTGAIETFDTHFSPTGSFRDTHLPPGFAPYALQVIGDQLFVASALQDSAAQAPVAGSGNGIIDVFDLEAHFVKRFFAGDAGIHDGIEIAILQRADERAGGGIERANGAVAETGDEDVV